MRTEPRAARLAAVALLGLFALGIASCDLNDLDQAQNSSNLAVVRAQFFASRDSRTPVPGVRMVVEADPDGDRPYAGPDVIAVSGEDGSAVAEVFPGYQQNVGGTGGGGGGTGGTGGTGTGQTVPQNPLEPNPLLYYADVAVTLVYQGQIVSLIAGGLTVGSGRLYDLGAVYLDDFGVTAD